MCPSGGFHLLCTGCMSRDSYRRRLRSLLCPLLYVHVPEFCLSTSFVVVVVTVYRRALRLSLSQGTSIISESNAQMGV